MSLAISTSWNAFRYENGQELLFEILGLGFKQVELSFNLTSVMVKEIGGLLNKKQFSVVSLHNYCPIPEGLKREEVLPDCFAMSSTDKGQRALAIKYTKRTIDTAVDLGAKHVVLHCGRVEESDATRTLIELYNQGLKSFPQFKALRERALKEREERKKLYFENTLNSLEELALYARDKNINLGIETRFYLCEIPACEEIGIILDKFKNLAVFYWHDTGHAQLMENLGIFRHKELLERYGNRMSGVHLHDITGCRDHQAPSKGGIDFNLLKPYLNQETVKVIEAHHPATAAEVKNSKIFLERLFDG